MSGLGRLSVAALSLLASACSAKVDPWAGPKTDADPERGDGGSRRGDGPALQVTAPDGAHAEAPAAKDGATCAEDIQMAQLVPVDLLVLVDGSESMGDMVGGGRSKLALVREAIIAFVRDQRSARLGVGLQFFPTVGPGMSCARDIDCGYDNGGPIRACEQVKMCAGMPDETGALRKCTGTCPGGAACANGGRCSMSGIDCTNVGMPCPGDLAGDVCVGRGTRCSIADLGGCGPAAAYENPLVPIVQVPGPGARFISRALEERGPNGATPMDVGVEGTLTYLRRHIGEHPGRRTLLVLATDGIPSCGQPIPLKRITDHLTAARQGTSPVSTYVIGFVEGANGMALEQLAMAGGTGTPFLIAVGNDFGARFLEALNQIRGKALPCEFTIPPPKMGTIDFGKVNLRLTSGGSGEDLLNTGGPDRCANGGWYYDTDPAKSPPTRVIVCPSTCGRFKAAPDAKVQLRFGCQTRYAE